MRVALLSFHYAEYSSRPANGSDAVNSLCLPLDASILDLGGGGWHIHHVLPSHSDITVCDISEQDLKTARERYGFKTVLLQETGSLPFRDQEFDFCFCWKTGLEACPALAAPAHRCSGLIPFSRRRGYSFG
jgi:hypothetical protein